MSAPYVLIGNSAAALAALDGIRRHDRSGRAVLLCGERGPAYSRVALPYYVSGQRSLEQLFIRQAVDYGRLGAELIDGAPVARIDAGRQQVELADGRRVAYDKLLIATGSVCAVPPIDGLDGIDAHYLWTLDDARGMKAAAERARTAVVIGGGFIGMLAAEALRKLHIQLTVVEMADQLLPQLLDAQSAHLFLGAVRDTGVTVRLNATVAAVGRENDGTRVTLRDGGSFAVDLVVVAAGVRPNLSALAGAPCRVATGVVVDEHLATDCSGVYAAGDVAEVQDFLSAEHAIHAIWPTAVEQGRVAGANMAGARIAYAGSLGMNVVELFGVTLAQVGRFREGPTDAVELLGRQGHALYRKVVVDRDGRLVGAMYLGDGPGVAEMGVIQAMIKRRSAWRELQKDGLARVTYATMTRAAQRSW